ncbi:MAG: DUF3592 domain-containing protein [Elusimicrobia bacterium]|nr:DUF3592 domain-containing protein [Elusimicrobiota bacterium]
MSEPIAVMGALWQVGGGAGAAFYVYKLVGFAMTRNHPQAVGRVVLSRVRAESSGSYQRPQRVRAAQVEYEYEVAGRTYRGDVIDAGGSLWTSSPARAEEVRRRYPEGSVVAVYYDPADPRRAFLERSPASLLIVLSGCVAVCVAGGFMRG